jgi:hypothetical protein
VSLGDGWFLVGEKANDSCEWVRRSTLRTEPLLKRDAHEFRFALAPGSRGNLEAPI